MESLTDCGAAGARTRMAGVCTPLDRDNLQGSVTRLLRMERGKGAGRARLDLVESGDSWRTGPSRATIQDVPLGVGNAPSDGNGTNEIALIPSRYSPLSRIVRDFRPNLWRLHLKHTLALAALQRPFQRAHGLMPPSFQSPPWPAPPSGGPAAGRCVRARRDGAAAGHVAAASDRLSEA